MGTLNTKYTLARSNTQLGIRYTDLQTAMLQICRIVLLGTENMQDYLLGRICLLGNNLNKKSITVECKKTIHNEKKIPEQELEVRPTDAPKAPASQSVQEALARPLPPEV